MEHRRRETINEAPLSSKGQASGEQPLATIAVIIPAYQAARHVAKVIAGIPPFVSHIIVVEDCSPDETAEVVSQCGDPRVVLVRHTENQGVGGAVMTGYRTAMDLGAEILVKMDSDGQMDPDYLLPLVAPLLSGEADYTKGNRFLNMRELRSMPLVRRLGNAGLSFMTKVASGYWNIFDPTNGYTALSAAVAHLLPFESISRRYFFESSMLLELSLLRGVVRDVPMPAIYGDEKSSLSVWKSLQEFPVRLFKGLLRRILVNYFVRDFGVLSLFFLAGLVTTAFGSGWGAYHWFQSVVTGKTASTGTVMVAVLPIVLGVQFLLQCVSADIQQVPTRALQQDLRLFGRSTQEPPADRSLNASA